MASYTSITDFMNMTVMRFYETWQAICAVCERRNKHIKEMQRRK